MLYVAVKLAVFIFCQTSLEHLLSCCVSRLKAPNAWTKTIWLSPHSLFFCRTFPLSGCSGTLGVSLVSSPRMCLLSTTTSSARQAISYAFVQEPCTDPCLNSAWLTHTFLKVVLHFSQLSKKHKFGGASLITCTELLRVGAANLRDPRRLLSFKVIPLRNPRSRHHLHETERHLREENEMRRLKKKSQSVNLSPPLLCSRRFLRWIWERTREASPPYALLRSTLPSPHTVSFTQSLSKLQHRIHS